jgi:hypothetical protein
MTTAIVVLTGAVSILAWTVGYRARAAATAALRSNAPFVASRAPADGRAFHRDSLQIGGRAVNVVRDGTEVSAVAFARTAGLARRTAADGLRTAVARDARAQLRVSIARADQARRAYATTDADIRNALAAGRVADLPTALRERSSQLDDLTRRQQDAQRDPRAAAALDPLIATKQQDLFDLRSLAARVDAATRARDDAVAARTQADADIAYWREVGASSESVPVVVRSSVSARYLPVRVGLTVIAFLVVVACTVELARDHRRRSAAQTGRGYARTTSRSVANTTTLSR